MNKINNTYIDLNFSKKFNSILAKKVSEVRMFVFARQSAYAQYCDEVPLFFVCDPE